MNMGMLLKLYLAIAKYQMYCFENKNNELYIYLIIIINTIYHYSLKLNKTIF